MPRPQVTGWRQRNERASHDDATEAHVDEALSDGVAIAEFPTTQEAASAAHRNGLAVLMGAPNVVRGKSHSDNISAAEVAANGHLDVMAQYKGHLVLVVGPSGAGKDSVLRGAMSELAGDRHFVFPRRFVTRFADAGAEDHLTLSEDDFCTAQKSGAFALTWQAHGNSYGIGRSIDADLEAGCIVAVNCSRGVLAEIADPEHGPDPRWVLTTKSPQHSCDDDVLAG